MAGASCSQHDDSVEPPLESSPWERALPIVYIQLLTGASLYSFSRSNQAVAAMLSSAEVWSGIYYSETPRTPTLDRGCMGCLTELLKLPSLAITV